MDWAKCALFQSYNNGLTDPSKIRKLQVDSYSILASHREAYLHHNIPLLSKIAVPSSNIAGGTNIAINLRQKQGKLHKTCALKVSSDRLKRKLLKDNDPSSKRNREHLSTNSELGSSKYIYCDMEAVFDDKGNVHEHNVNKDDKDQIVHKINFLEIPHDVSQAVEEMEDIEILAKLAGAALGKMPTRN